MAMHRPLSTVIFYLNARVPANTGFPACLRLDCPALSSGVVFHGTFGASYAFYTVGIDAAGNREAAPPVPDVQTTVGISNRPPVLSMAASAAVDEGETFRLTLAVLDPDLPGSPSPSR